MGIECRPIAGISGPRAIVYGYVGMIRMGGNALAGAGARLMASGAVAGAEVAAGDARIGPTSSAIGLRVN